MKTIYKYTLKPEGVLMPVGAKLLSAAIQGNNVCVWAEVDTQAMRERVEFELLGTGDEIVNNEYEFVDTVLTDAGKYVLHVYKRVKGALPE